MMKSKTKTIKPNNETFDDLTDYELFIMKHAIGLDYSKNIQIKTNYYAYKNKFRCLAATQHKCNTDIWKNLFKKDYATIIKVDITSIVFAVNNRGLQAISNSLNKNIKIDEDDYFLNHYDAIAKSMLRFGTKRILPREQAIWKKI